MSLKGNKAGRRWEPLAGYTLSDLIKRLNKTMPEGYTWQDYLTGKLQVDHIIPRSVFNFTRPEHTDFKRCWALNNLRLLPARENSIKSNHLKKPFQPALKI
jgi:5-methylcytosine-specific restriction endonuclease McrA